MLPSHSNSRQYQENSMGLLSTMILFTRSANGRKLAVRQSWSWGAQAEKTMHQNNHCRVCKSFIYAALFRLWWIKCETTCLPCWGRAIRREGDHISATRGRSSCCQHSVWIECQLFHFGELLEDVGSWTWVAFFFLVSVPCLGIRRIMGCWIGFRRTPPPTYKHTSSNLYMCWVCPSSYWEISSHQIKQRSLLWYDKRRRS